MPVLLGLRHAEHGARRRRNDDRHPLAGLPPKADGTLLANIVMRGKRLMGQHVEGGQQQWCDLTFGHQHLEESLERIEQRLGLLIAVDHHQQLAAGRLPEMHQVEGFGREG